MEAIITLTDIQNIRQITSNIDAVSVAPYIIEAQNVDLRKLLGIKFYNVLRKGLATGPIPTRFTDLVSGKLFNVDDVEIEYQGLKPLVAYYAYARAITHLGKRVSRFGMVKKTTNFSEPVEKDELAASIIEAKSNAKVYEEDLVYFLENNKEVYPEYFTCEQPRIKSGVKISAVGINKNSYE